MDFTPFGNPTGPHGVGCKRIWTKKNDNHVLVFYPISQKQYAKGLQNVNNLYPFTIFGEKQAF